MAEFLMAGLVACSYHCWTAAEIVYWVWQRLWVLVVAGWTAAGIAYPVWQRLVVLVAAGWIAAGIAYPVW